ncbi:hypothetical protein CAPTEDRAFT_194222 [Capitella teleta]|uniref:Uncharacterized protein n=1 Tax=Capitella teleta TaxID=283909 RepID=R7T485_CAPTE|nr:hypothetical protein CAPTEDRAFT_194222 [Capitella teleta]|eukprot:ELT87648.1 hypothetical protein CAPTEDRAFT_194222 [Capitella teleta]
MSDEVIDIHVMHNAHASLPPIQMCLGASTFNQVAILKSRIALQWCHSKSCKLLSRTSLGVVKNQCEMMKNRATRIHVKNDRPFSSQTRSTELSAHLSAVAHPDGLPVRKDSGVHTQHLEPDPEKELELHLRGECQMNFLARRLLQMEGEEAEQDCVYGTHTLTQQDSRRAIASSEKEYVE